MAARSSGGKWIDVALGLFAALVVVGAPVFVILWFGLLQ